MLPCHYTADFHQWQVDLTGGILSKLPKLPLPFQDDYDKIAKCWFLTTCFNLKNYDQEIEKFLDWLCPYIQTEGYIGTYWYEEQEEPK